MGATKLVRTERLSGVLPPAAELTSAPLVWPG